MFAELHSIKRILFWAGPVVILAGLSPLSAFGQEQGEIKLPGKQTAPEDQLKRSEAIARNPSPTSSEPAAQANDEAGKPGVQPKAKIAEPESTGAPQNVRLRMNFMYTPWDDVIEDFAARAGLAIVTDPLPTLGTLNYQDPREHTLLEALDILNGILLTKGYTMLRRDKMLMIINLEDGIPPSLVIEVPSEQLDRVGKYELSKTRFRLRRMTADEAKEAAEKMVSDQGSVVAVGPNQIVVTETGGNLRLIRDMINGVEKPKDGSDEVRVFSLEHATTDDVLAIARPLLGLEEESNVNDDIQISPDPFGNKIYATGLPAAVDRLEQIVEAVDQANVAGGGDDMVVELPNLEVHEVNSDPTTAYEVLSTMLAGETGVRLAIDPETQNLVAMATPTQHKTIAAVLKQLEAEAVTTETIQLYNKDPAEAVLLINSLFGLDDEENAAKGPKIDGDLTTGRLIVRGKPDEIKQIRELLAEVDPEPGTIDPGQRSNVRTIPLTGRAAAALLEQAELFWPTTGRANRIRVVPLHDQTGPLDRPAVITNPESQSPAPPRPKEEPPAKSDDDRADGDKSAAVQRRQVPVRYIARRSADPRRSTGELAALLHDRAANRRFVALALRADAARVSKMLAKPQGEVRLASLQTAAPQEKGQAAAPEIIVTLTRNGIVIASNDLDALDDYERLLQTLNTRSEVKSLPTFFYLKYRQAEPMAAKLQEILGGDTGAAGDDLAASVTGAAGSLISGLLGDDTTGMAPSIIADTRNNALIVQATAEDLDFIEILLRELDREYSREDYQLFGTPQMIPIYNTSAEEVAQVVKQVYADQIASDTSSQQQQQQRGGQPRINPADFINALRGGGGPSGRGSGGPGGGQRGGTGSSTRQEQLPKMRVSTDARSNSLVVSAPQPLFEDVKALVGVLDYAGTQTPEATTVVTLRRANPAVVQQALTSILGDKASVSGGDNASNTSTSRNDGDRNSRTPTSASTQEQIQRRIDFFNALRGAAGRGGGAPGSGRGGFTPGGGFRGGGGAGPGGGGFRGGPGGSGRGGR